ncbi:MAG: hypothetical protein WD078_04140 [Woeseia sp.]
MSWLTGRGAVIPGRGAPGLSLTLIVAALGIAALGGVVGATGNVNMYVTLVALLAAAVMLVSRSALLWFAIFGGTVIVGVLQLYWPETRYVRYVFPLVGCGLVLHGILDLLARAEYSRAAAGPAIWPWAAGFFGIALLSLLINFSSLDAAVMGLKTYFQMWPFLLGLVLVRWSPGVIRTIPRAMLLIVFLQLPFVVHQYVFLVPLRYGLGTAPVGFQPADIVAGTFGAHLYGGGANAVLAAFMMMALACFAGLWKHGALTTPRAVLLSLLCISPLLLNQTKISVLYLLLVFVVLFFRDVVKKPATFVLAALSMAGLLAVLMTAMVMTHGHLEDRSWRGLIDFTVQSQQTTIRERSGQFSELTRWTALTFWAEEHSRANPVTTLIGHGPGASRVQEEGLSGTVDSLAKQRYNGLQIGYTALSALLWDTGIVGLVVTLGLFLSAFRSAGWISAHYRGRDPFRAGLFEGLRAAIAVLALSLAHKDFYIYHMPYQTLVLLVLGFLMVYRQQIVGRDDVTAE